MIATALLMGLAGSLHCVGMCSPLAMTVSHLTSRAMVTRLVYNLGRILTYGTLGVMVGAATWLMPLAKFQNIVSIVLGAALILLALTGTTSLRIPFLTTPLQKFRNMIINVFGKVIQRKKLISTFVLGALNGLLPCGLTFLALTFCITLGGPVESFGFMILFGIGTLPAMLGITSVFQFLITKYHINVRKVTTVTLAISGTLLIARIFMFHETAPSNEEQHLVDIIICRSK